jgi:Family of unknown function (DUF6502)
MAVSAFSAPGSKPPITVLVSALRRLLRPVIRLAIHYGLTYPSLAEMLKSVYVEVADLEFQIDGKPQTDSRVSMLTGVHRKDVKRLRSESAVDMRELPKSVSLGAQIAAVWSSRPEYLTRDGEPRPLARLSADESQPSFDSLVRSVSRDIRSRVVLDEWLRLGVVSMDEDNVVLNRAAFVPASGFEEKAFYLGQNLHDHAAAIAHNVVTERAPMLERCVHYDGIDGEAITDLANAAEVWGMRALRAVNSKVLEGGEVQGSGLGKWRMNFGLYFYAEPMDAPQSKELQRDGT